MTTMSYSSARIAVPTNDGIEIYDSAEILRCEADKTSSFIYLADGSYVLSTKSLKHFEKLLASWDFMRVHKGNLINIYHIRKYLKGKRSTVVLSDSSSVEVASRKKNELLKIISSFPLPSVRQVAANGFTKPEMQATKNKPRVRKAKDRVAEIDTKRKAS